MSAYNSYSGYHGQGPPAGSNYRLPQTDDYGGENPFSSYSSGYMSSGSLVEQYPWERNAHGGGYPEQDARQIDYHQRIDGGYGYEGQGNSSRYGQGDEGSDYQEGFWQRGESVDGYGLSEGSSSSYARRKRRPNLDFLIKLLEKWRVFNLTFPYCANPVSTLVSSLTTSKVGNIKLNYTSEMIKQFRKGAHICYVFTGSLYVIKAQDEESKDGIFLARGLGLCKKSTKADAYLKAYNLMMHASIDEIVSQEDTSNAALVKEVTISFDKDPNRFWALLKNAGQKSDGGTEAVIEASRKRQAPLEKCDQYFRPKRRRSRKTVASTASLIPQASSKPPQSKDQAEPAMSSSDSLFDKLNRLKKLLKEEGITKLHIVPKIDQFGIRSGLDIKNVYRFTSVPAEGEEHDTPFICEVYFDNLLISKGDASLQSLTAMYSAYTRLAERLCKEPTNSIVNSSKQKMEESDLTHCEVIDKMEAQDCTLTTNMVSMKQDFCEKPDLSIPFDNFVLMEFEAEKGMDKSMQTLMKSASLNGMLLEYEMVCSEEQRFICRMSIQGKQLCNRTSNNKLDAKQMCADAIIDRLKETKDIVLISKHFIGPTYTWENFLARSVELMDEGHVKSSGTFSPTQKAIANIILNHCKKITLEDLKINCEDMLKDAVDKLHAVVANLGLRCSLVKKYQKVLVLRRFIPALEITKILGVNNGESGRYKLKQCRNPWSTRELEEYKKESIAKYTKMFEDFLKK